MICTISVHLCFAQELHLQAYGLHWEEDIVCKIHGGEKVCMQDRAYPSVSGHTQI